MKNLRLIELKDIITKYDRHLQAAHNESFANGGNCLDYFVSYLRYMRDCRLLINDSTDGVTASLIAAIDEYDRYLALKDGDVSKSEHWANFWELVSYYINQWKIFND